MYRTLNVGPTLAVGLETEPNLGNEKRDDCSE